MPTIRPREHDRVSRTFLEEKIGHTGQLCHTTRTGLVLIKNRLCYCKKCEAEVRTAGQALNQQKPDPEQTARSDQGELRPETATSLLTIAAAMVFGWTESRVLRPGSDGGWDACIIEAAGC